MRFFTTRIIIAFIFQSLRSSFNGSLPNNLENHNSVSLAFAFVHIPQYVFTKKSTTSASSILKTQTIKTRTNSYTIHKLSRQGIATHTSAFPFSPLSKQTIHFSATPHLDIDETNNNPKEQFEDVILKTPKTLSSTSTHITTTKNQSNTNTHSDTQNTHLLHHTKQESISTEFWLDLRETAITPYAALEYLYKEVSKDFESFGWDVIQTDDGNIIVPDMVHRILLSDGNGSRNTVMNDDEGNGDGDGLLEYDLQLRHFVESLEIVYTSPSDHSTLFQLTPKAEASSSKSSQPISIPFGKRLPMSGTNTNTNPSVEVADPIFAMDCLSSDQWIVLDYPTSSDRLSNESKAVSSLSTSSLDSKERMQKVSDLVDFLALTSSTTMTSSSSSSSSSSGQNFSSNILYVDGKDGNDVKLILPNNSKNVGDNDICVNDNGGETARAGFSGPRSGGIAIVCKTGSDLLEGGASLQQFQYQVQTGLSHSMSDGGIALMQSTSTSRVLSEEELDDEKVGKDYAVEDHDSKKGVAMVIPFDMSLWKTIAFMFDKSQDLEGTEEKEREVEVD